MSPSSPLGASVCLFFFAFFWVPQLISERAVRTEALGGRRWPRLHLAQENSGNVSVGGTGNSVKN